MAKLTDTAAIVLSAAAARDNHRILPLPKLKAPPVAVKKALHTMLENGLVEEIAAGRDDEAWEPSDAKGRTTLIATAAGLAAIGIVDVSTESPRTKTRTKPAKGRGHGQTGRNGTKTAKTAGRPRTGDSGGKKVSKQDIVIALVRRANGASIEEMMQATGWQAHSVRGWMSGAAKKRLGLTLISEKTKAGGRRYYVAAIK